MNNNWVKFLKDYSVNDFLSKVSVLSLLPENQNKDFVFDEIIDGILQNNSLDFIGKNIISKNRFEQIVNQVFISKSHLLDPNEYPFIQRVQFYGDKWVFNGRNMDGAYRLQMFINSIILYKNDFDEEFKNTISLMLEFLLRISDSIVNKLRYGINDLKEYNNSSILFPDSNKTKKLIDSITLNINNYDFIKHSTYFNELFCDFGCPSNNSPENYFFTIIHS